MVEKIIIGTLLKSAKSISQVDGFLKPCHFSDNTYAKIYEQILNEPEVSLLNLAKKMGLELPFLVDMALFANEPALVNNCIDLVNKYLCKETAIRAERIKEIATAGDIEQAYDELEKTINDIKATASGSEIKTLKEILKESELKLSDRVNKCRNNEMLGVPLPFKELQYITAGLQQGLYILAARPGQGKTAMGLKFARTALEKGFVVAYFSLEMSAVSLIDRMVVGESGVSKNKYRHGALTDADLMTIEMKRKRIASMGLNIIDYPVQNINTIRRESRILKRSGLRLIIVDYIQLIQTISKKSYNRENEVSEISRGLKLLSKELDVPIIVMAQLNRESEKDGKFKRPTMAQLRESGAIEQDADMVMLLFRPDMAGIKDYEDGVSTENVIEIIIAKNREGDLTTIPVRHNGTMTEFYDMDKQLNSETLTF